MKSLLIAFLATLASSTLCNAQTSGKNMQAGQVSDKVVLLDYEYASDFENGFAALKKGNKLACSDYQGHFVIPYGDFTEAHFTNGYIFLLNNTFGTSIYDSRYKLIAKFRGTAVGEINDYGFIENSHARYTFVGKEQDLIPPEYQQLNKNYGRSNGARVTVHRGSESQKLSQSQRIMRGYPELSLQDHLFNNGLAVMEIDYNVGGKKYGFVNKLGRTVIKPIYTNAGFFSEGLAAVAIKDEFGKEKWGFIDTAGKTVIPFKFSIQPGNFYSNRAVVFPADANGGFDYGYINKQGTVVIKVEKADWYLPNFSPNNINFHNGYAMLNYYPNAGKSSFSTRAVVDTSGKIYKGVDLPKDRFVGMQGDQILFTSGNQYESGGRGMMNIFGEVVIPPVFDELGFFDKTSGLALAKYAVNRNEYREGYIDKTGKFVLLKKPAEKW